MLRRFACRVIARATGHFRESLIQQGYVIEFLHLIVLRRARSAQLVVSLQPSNLNTRIL